jgi:glycosyltransferase involved in cell wall biosynthesis
VQERVHVYTHLPVQELVALYNRAELLAFPSLYEGFGLPIIEAMACGTPVLTSRRGSLAEIAGDSAHYVDPTSVASICEGLRRMTSDPGYRQELRRAGMARAAQFSWETAAMETHAIYERVLHQGHAIRSGSGAAVNERRHP